MQTLRESGFVESLRGKFGGYRLAKPAHEIRIGEIVRLIDGPLAPIGCVSHSAYESCSCPDEDHCGLRMLMIDVRNAIAGILDRYSLADVVEVTLRKMRRDRVTPPFGTRLRRLRSGRTTRRTSVVGVPNLAATEGVVQQLIGDYSI